MSKNIDRPLRVVPVMILAGVILGVAHNLVSGNPVPWKAEPKTAVALDEMDPGNAGEDGEAAEPRRLGGIPESEFPVTVDLARAKQLHDGGVAIFLDARDLEEYAEAHIEGALYASYDEFGGDPDWLDEMAVAPKVLVIYCGGGECELSLNLGFALTQAGHRHVVVFEEGIGAWEEAGYPTATGEPE